MGVRTIDLHWLGQPRAIATYALDTSGGVVLVDPGPFICNDALVRGLAHEGVAVEDVRCVLITHIHLDHAGGAWWWARHGGKAQQRPTIAVHAFGAKHMIDPSKLLASAQRIYGEQMEALWGALEPIDATHVRPLDDGDVVEVGDRAFTVHESPGHARHHHAFAMEDDALGRVCFCGDVAGMTVQHHPEYISLPTPPPEFDLEQWLRSLERLHRMDFDAIYPTHFGVIEDVAGHLPRVGVALRAHDAFIGERVRGGSERDAIVDDYRAWLIDEARGHGLDEAAIRRHITAGTLVDMNVTGIMRAWKRRMDAAEMTSEQAS